MLNNEEQTKNENKELFKSAEGTKEVNNKSNNKKNISHIEEARQINEEKAKLLEQEEKLLERKEKMEAEKMIGGYSQAGQNTDNQETETEKRIREDSEGIVNAFR